MKKQNPHFVEVSLDEIRDIHPIVAFWLTKNGYSYIHEYKLPDFGRVDFYATHADGHTLLVEAKGDDSLTRALFQVLGYSVQISGAKTAIAAPTKVITERFRAIADKYNVVLIEIDTLLIEQKKRTEKILRDYAIDFRNELIQNRENLLNLAHNEQWTPSYLVRQLTIDIFILSQRCYGALIVGLGMEKVSAIEFAANGIQSVYSYHTQKHDEFSIAYEWLNSCLNGDGFYDLFQIPDNLPRNTDSCFPYGF